MSKFRKIVEGILLETKILRVPTWFDENEILTVLKNPSPYEYFSFKSNTRFNSIRGIATDKNIYVVDADVWLHDNLISALEEYGELTDSEVHTMFDEDNNGNLQVRGTPNARLQEIIDAHKEMIPQNNLSFFDIQNFYDAYQSCSSEYQPREWTIKNYGLTKEQADKYCYDDKPPHEKDDFNTWLRKTGLSANVA